MQVLVVGGGVAGLAAALSLSRAGHAVHVLERDATPLPASPVEAFERWDRSGAPQVWHSHAFLARLRSGLLARTPDVMQALWDHGAYDLRFADYLPPMLLDRTPEPADAELTLFACRRITFEWVLRRSVLASGNVHWHEGAEVRGLIAATDPPSGIARVTGAHVAVKGKLETWPADLVVDASGRRSRLPRWLAEIGARAVEQEEEECGIFYCSRFYRLLPGATPPERQGVVGADLGYMKLGIFPGDGGIFSITLAADLSDDPLRAILHEAPFEAAARAFPATRDWVDPTRATPVTPVRAMAKLVNRRRRFVVDGAPLATGVLALGDAAICTNPLYGRGCTLAFVHAWELEDAIAAHAGDLHSLALAFDAATRREIEPWYRAARDQDREARAASALLLGTRSEPQASEGHRDGLPELQPVDPKEFMRSVFRDGLLPALRSDIQVVRAFMRAFNLLVAPDALMTNPDVIGRVLAAWREREQRAPIAIEGPARAEMLELLRRAA